MPIPRHRALSETLTQEIAEGHFPVGSRFPGEQELQQRFNVGRHTAREALKTLTEQGLLGRRQKAGTRVLALVPFTRYAHTLGDARGLFDFADDTSLRPDYVGFVRELNFPMDGFDDLPKPARWLRIAGVRTRRGDNVPLCWSEIYVPSTFPLDREDIRDGLTAVYQLCIERFGLKLRHVEQEIQAASLPAAIARLLSVEPESAALLVKRRYVAAPNSTFEISANLYPASRYSVRTVIR